MSSVTVVNHAPSPKDGASVTEVHLTPGVKTTEFVTVVLMFLGAALSLVLHKTINLSQYVGEVSTIVTGALMATYVLGRVFLKATALKHVGAGMVGLVQAVDPAAEAEIKSVFATFDPANPAPAADPAPSNPAPVEVPVTAALPAPAAAPTDTTPAAP